MPLRAVIVLIVVFVGLAAAFVSRFAGLLLYLWFAFFRPQEFAWGEFDSLRLSLVIGIVFVVSALASGWLPNLTHPLSLGMVGFFVAALVATFGATNSTMALLGLDQLGRAILVSLLAITIINSRRRLLIAVAVVSASLGAHGVKLGVWWMIHGGAQLSPAIGGMFGDNNDFALAISRIIIPLFVVSLLSEARWVRAGYRMAAPLALAGLVATYSRGGFLAVSGSTLAYLMLSRRRLIGVAAVVLGLAVLQIRAVLPQTYVERLSTIAADDEERDASAESRLHFWRVAVRMASDHPLGVGLKNYPYEYDRYDDTDGLYGTQRAVHSSHFEVLAETGWVGMAFWLSLNGGALLILYRIRRRALQSARSDENARFYVTMANGLLASHVAFLIGGAFLAQVLNELNWTTFAFVAVLHRLSARELVRVPAPQQQRTPAPPPRPRPRLRMPA